MTERRSEQAAPAQRRAWTTWLISLTALAFGVLLWASESPPKSPPATHRIDVTETLHGVAITDPYRWLEDRKSPQTEAWIEQQNRYTQSILESLPGRAQLRQRLGELIKIDSIGMPREHNGRYFFLKRRADQELPVLYFRQGLHGKDEVLVDPHPMSADHSTSVSLLDVSLDGTLIMYGLRHGGEDEVVPHLLNVETRQELPDRLPKGRYFGIAIKPDKSGFYYSRHRAEGTRVYYHPMGADPAADAEIFGKGYGPDKGIGSALSDDGRYLLVEVFYGAAAERSEVYFRDEAKQGALVPIVNDLHARFSGEFGGDQLFLHTNWKAPKGRVLAVDLAHPERERWREVVPETDAVVEGVSLAGGKVFVNYLKDVRSRMSVFEPDGKHVRDIQLPAIGSLSTMDGHWLSKEGFFEFESFHIPRTIYHYDVARGSQDIWARLNVPVESEKFDLKQVWYQSKDKTRVPMFVLHRKGLQLDGSNPGYLTGYGGFNISETPAFSARAVLWAEQGGVYALPNLRGGGEFGEDWHHAGMRERKQNVFDDFIAGAEWLTTNGYSRPSKLAISGRSNGGLLMGAALTQRPDLFGAVVCGYPLLDMLRYQKFLVAQLWVPEYGSSEDADQFRYIYAYSPYQHVTSGIKYPAVIFFSGDGDTRVDPLHARKMAALLQWATGSQRPVLVHYDTKAGHTNAAPVSQQIDDLVDELSFLSWQLDDEGR